MTAAAAIFSISCTDGNGVAVPNEVQKEWAEAEIGVIIHLDMPVFVPEYNFREWGSHPDASVFNPTDLDTDQWLKTAADMGAKYAVLVAKHCSGFSLWPTEAHGYSVRNSPWKDGKGDIVRVRQFLQKIRHQAGNLCEHHSQRIPPCGQSRHSAAWRSGNTGRIQ